VRFIVGENQQGLTAEEVTLTDVTHTNSQPADGYLSGAIARIAPSFQFGFIQSDDGREIFFHRSELKTPGHHMSRLSPGMRVQFILSKNEKGLIALSVEEPLDSFLEDAVRSGLRIEGKISVRNQGSTYAFVHLVGSGHVVVRSQDFRHPSAWDLIEIGDKVSFVVERGINKGFIGRDIELEEKS
jgi:cold shock CspA family protein